MEGADGSLKIHNKAGFQVKRFEADPEFDCMKQELEDNNIDVNICAAEELCQRLKEQ